MDFFASQEQARRKTALLIFYFCLAVILIILAVYAVIAGAITLSQSSRTESSSSGMFIGNVELLAGVSVVTVIVVLAGSLYKVSLLKSGGRRVAEMLGGQLVPPNTTRLNERKLLNIVEEMSLAAGVATPPVYVQKNESGINAFAAGYGQADAIVCVTQGTLDHLSRDELQGVLAHEFSHILNGDMRLNIKLIGVLHGILLIAIIGRIMTQGASRGRGKGRAGAALIGIGLLCVGYIGVFFGKLIKSGVSRLREYLADASAVQFTRNPAGIAGALKKIGGLTQGSRIHNLSADEASHMFFADALKQGWFGLLATHPPLEDRIQRIDPSFDGVFPKLTRTRKLKPPPKHSASNPHEAILPIPDKLASPILMATAALPSAAMASLGSTLEDRLSRSQALIRQLPQELLTSAREPYSARALVFVLLLDENPELRSRQIAFLRDEVPSPVYFEIKRFSTLRSQLQPDMRLPLLDLAMPALKTLSKLQYEEFMARVNTLIMTDNQVSLFEFVAGIVLKQTLHAHFERPTQVRARIRNLPQVTQEVSTVLSCLAIHGHKDKQEAMQAFNAAVRHLGAPATPYHYLTGEEISFPLVERSLQRLSETTPLLRKWILVACLTCLAHDKQATTSEMEMFRAIAAALDSPPITTNPGPQNNVQQ